MVGLAGIGQTRHYTRNMSTMISRVLIRTLIGRSRSLREICSGRMRLSSVRRSACNVRTNRTPYGSILATWTRQQSHPINGKDSLSQLKRRKIAIETSTGAIALVKQAMGKVTELVCQVLRSDGYTLY